MLLRRPGYKVDINAILRACAEYIWEGVLPRKMRATECLLGSEAADIVQSFFAIPQSPEWAYLGVAGTF
jgi:hypothetical protein